VENGDDGVECEVSSCLEDVGLEIGEFGEDCEEGLSKGVSGDESEAGDLPSNDHETQGTE
jgi:hypothetical protein